MRFIANSEIDLLGTLQSNFPDASKTTLRQMLEQGRVRVNGEFEKNARRALTPGDRIEIGRKNPSATLPDELKIIYEDDDIIVVIKKEGLLSVATKGEQGETAQAYLGEYLRAKKAGRIHVVHRLDRATSGVMMFAKNFETREILKDTFAAHDIERVYIAVVEGRPPSDRGTIRTYLEENERNLKVYSVDDPKRGKLAVTHYRVLRAGKRYSMLEVTLETGRRNQIRVHFAEGGFPVVGDTRYGAKADPIGRLGLHAQLLGFAHPQTGKKMTFNAALPEGFRKLEL